VIDPVEAFPPIAGKNRVAGVTHHFDTDARGGNDMPYGQWINELPTNFFLTVHVAAFVIGAGFAWLAFRRELGLLGGGFALFAAAEVSYMTYHVDWTVFLFAHTISEVLDLGAFVLVFAGAILPLFARGTALEGSRP
jgi:hypothetical protein